MEGIVTEDNNPRFEKKQRLRFDDWSMTNSEYEPLLEAMWTARYDLKGLTLTQAYLLVEACESYRHLVAHPTSTKSIIAQLRKVRRAIKDGRKQP